MIRVLASMEDSDVDLTALDLPMGGIDDPKRPHIRIALLHSPLYGQTPQTSGDKSSRVLLQFVCHIVSDPWFVPRSFRYVDSADFMANLFDVSVLTFQCIQNIHLTNHPTLYRS